MTDVSFHDYAKLDAAGRAALLKRSETDLTFFLDKVGPIIEAVRTEGDAALVRFARDLDKARQLEVNRALFDFGDMALGQANALPKRILGQRLCDACLPKAGRYFFDAHVHLSVLVYDP